METTLLLDSINDDIQKDTRIFIMRSHYIHLDVCLHILLVNNNGSKQYNVNIFSEVLMQALKLGTPEEVDNLLKDLENNDLKEVKKVH